ncbi:MAG: multidrug DMT transporter permease [Chitinophagaceae bacterium]|nr:multidrug DMT transporter permease [Chitinophagaceae bacterium]
MFIVQDYSLAIVCCFITMLCWGSWANTQKLVTGKWRFELFYWDYVIGILVFSVVAALTLGSWGSSGRSFLDDLAQASSSNIGSAFLGGIIFNLANILLTAAIAIAGMSVAFPVGIGIALVLGVIINYMGVAKGDPALLFGGVALVMLAIILNAVAYKKASSSTSKATTKGILLSIAAGVLMSFFYRFIAVAMDLNNFVNPEPLKMTPYTAFVVFAVGIFASNFIFNTVMMKKPLEGSPVSYKDYFSGKFPLHLVGVLGGAIWGTGNLLNLLAAGKAGPAVSYGLGQGATLVAAIWGVLVWKEFRHAQGKVTGLLVGMFACFIVGLILIIVSGA